MIFLEFISAMFLRSANFEEEKSKILTFFKNVISFQEIEHFYIEIVTNCSSVIIAKLTLQDGNK